MSNQDFSPATRIQTAPTISSFHAHRVHVVITSLVVTGLLEVPYFQNCLSKLGVINRLTADFVLAAAVQIEWARFLAQSEGILSRTEPRPPILSVRVGQRGRTTLYELSILGAAGSDSLAQ
jgi:hypothetical protein